MGPSRLKSGVRVEGLCGLLLHVSEICRRDESGLSDLSESREDLRRNCRKDDWIPREVRRIADQSVR